MKRIPTTKIILASIGACLASVILSGILVACGGMGGIVLGAVLLLFFIETARQRLAKKYGIGLWQFMVLTMLPSVLLFEVLVWYFINNPKPELEGMLDQIALMVYGGCIGVAVVGTLIIALIRKIMTLSEKTNADHEGEAEQKVE